MVKGTRGLDCRLASWRYLGPCLVCRRTYCAICCQASAHCSLQALARSATMGLTGGRAQCLAHPIQPTLHHQRIGALDTATANGIAPGIAPSIGQPGLPVLQAAQNFLHGGHRGQSLTPHEENFKYAQRPAGGDRHSPESMFPRHSSHTALAVSIPHQFVFTRAKRPNASASREK